MRSRADEVDAAAAVDWALENGVVGVGSFSAATELHRIEARLRRFSEVANGSFVWTRDADGFAFVGQITGPVRDEPAGAAHDLQQVRPCRWHPEPVPESAVPAAVAATFDRGGRNFQRVNAAGVGHQTARLWASLSPGDDDSGEPVRGSERVHQAVARRASTRRTDT